MKNNLVLLVSFLCFFACNNEKLVFSDLDLKWEKISLYHEGKTLSLDNSKERKGVLPYPFYVDTSKLEVGLKALQTLEFVENPKGIQLKETKRSFLKLKTSGKHTQIETFESDTHALIRIKDLITKKETSGYTLTKRLKKVFSKLSKVQSTKFHIPDNFEMIYKLTGRVLSKEHQEEFFKILKNVKKRKIITSNIFLENKVKNYGLGIFQNENLKAGFRLTNNDKEYTLLIARPTIDRPIIRLWNSYEGVVLEGEFHQWKELKELEKKFR